MFDLLELGFSGCALLCEEAAKVREFRAMERNVFELTHRSIFSAKNFQYCIASTIGLNE